MSEYGWIIANHGVNLVQIGQFCANIETIDDDDDNNDIDKAAVIGQRSISECNL